MADLNTSTTVTSNLGSGGFGVGARPGADGEPGIGIKTITQPNGNDSFRITLDDLRFSDITLPRGPAGADGKTPFFSPGTTVASDPGSAPTLGLRLVAPGTYALDASIPSGQTGPAPTINFGDVTTGAAGSSASATFSPVAGSPGTYQFNLTVPRGNTGAKGNTGDTGPTPWQPQPAPWSGPGTVYSATAPASTVTYQGSSYVCSTSHTSTSAFEPDKFTLLAQRGNDGTGTVNGPASAADGSIAVFNGTTGTLIRDGGKSLADLGRIPRSARTANTQLVAADMGKFIDITSGSFTQTIAAAAGLGAGWSVYLKNSGTGVITLDPNGAETVDGLATIRLYQGESLTLICDGTLFKTVGRGKGPILISSAAVSSPVATVDFETGFDDPEFSAFQVSIFALSHDNGSNTQVGLRYRKSGSYVATGYTAVNPAGTDRSGGGTQIGFSGAYSPTADQSVEINLTNTNSALASQQIALIRSGNQAGNVLDSVAGYQNTAAAVQGVRFLALSGLIDGGTFRLFGVR